LVSMDQAIALVQNSIKLTGKRDFGLNVGEGLCINSHGALGMAMLSCRTLDEVFKLLSEFMVLLFPYSKSTYTKGIRSSCFDFGFIDFAKYENKFIVEMVFSCIYSTIKLLTGVEFPDVRFDFSSKIPEEDESHYDLLGNEIFFEKKTCRVVLPENTRDMQLRFYEPVTLRVAVDQCKTSLKRIRNREKMEIKVNEAINIMSIPFPDIEAVSSRLNMCSRTLRRKLKLEGVTFQEILDEKRKKIAIKYLTETNMSITQISTELYFSDSSYFSRAFKRWTGMLPKVYRLSVVA